MVGLSRTGNVMRQQRGHLVAGVRIVAKTLGILVPQIERTADVARINRRGVVLHCGAFRKPLKQEEVGDENDQDPRQTNPDRPAMPAVGLRRSAVGGTAGWPV